MIIDEDPIAFPCVIWFDPIARCWVGYIPALDVYSAGTPLAETQKAVDSAADMFVRHCMKRGINPLASARSARSVN